MRINNIKHRMIRVSRLQRIVIFSGSQPEQLTELCGLKEIKTQRKKIDVKVKKTMKSTKVMTWNSGLNSAGQKLVIILGILPILTQIISVS